MQTSPYQIVGISSVMHSSLNECVENMSPVVSNARGKRSLKKRDEILCFGSKNVIKCEHVKLTANFLGKRYIPV